FKKGVYNYIKEDYDPASRQMIPRKYFSGGFDGEKVDGAVRDGTFAGDFAQLTPERREAVVKGSSAVGAERKVTWQATESDQEGRAITDQAMAQQNFGDTTLLGREEILRKALVLFESYNPEMGTSEKKEKASKSGYVQQISAGETDENASEFRAWYEDL